MIIVQITQVKIVWMFFCQDLNEKINTIINIPQKPMDSLTEQDGSNYDFHLISHFNLVA